MGLDTRLITSMSSSALLTRKAALVDGLQGRKSLELISALYEFIETRQEVALRFTPRHSRLGMVP